MTSPATPDQFDALASALYSYLLELDDARRVCFRHETTAGVRVRAGSLCLARAFRRTPLLEEYLRKAAQLLPRWERSPFWASDGVGWERARASAGHRRDIICHIGVSWEERPLLVTGRASCTALRVEVLALPYRSDLPAHPVFDVAGMLRCHELLVPPTVGEVLPRDRWAGQAWQSPSKSLAGMMGSD